MKKKKNNDRKKLTLARETLSPLESLDGVAAGACPQESNRICSIQHTCVSCVFTQDTCA